MTESQDERWLVFLVNTGTKTACGHISVIFNKRKLKMRREKMKNRFFGEYKLVYAGQGTNRAQVNKALWIVQNV